MHLLLTGATGTIGSAILRRSIERGHDVTAAVRSTEKADLVEAAGATGVVTDFADSAHLVYLMKESDGVIHTAADGDDAEGFDRRVAKAAIEALGGEGTPYVHTGGAWLWGEGDAITEDDPIDPPAVTAWRPGVIALLEQADLALTVVHPGIVYGDDGGGLAGVAADGPRDEQGRRVTIGSGDQHWTTIHVDDLAALYVAVLEEGRGFGAVLGVSGVNPTVRAMTEAAAGGTGITTEAPSATRARLGDALAEALLTSQQATGAKARTIGGWVPSRPPLLDLLRA